VDLFFALSTKIQVNVIPEWESTGTKCAHSSWGQRQPHWPHEHL